MDEYEFSIGGRGFYEVEEECPYCHMEYYCEYEDQVAGFRDMDYKVCPYCKAVLGRSMETEFHTRRKR